MDVLGVDIKKMKWQSAHDSALNHVCLKCNKCLEISLLLLHLVLYQTEKQTGSIPSTSLHSLGVALLTHNRDGLSRAYGWLSLSVSFMLLTYLETFSLHFFSIELVPCPFCCSLSALWFPAVSSRHQLTFSSVFRMTTNLCSCQPFSASSPKPFQPPNLPTHAVHSINTLLRTLRSFFKDEHF